MSKRYVSILATAAILGGLLVVGSAPVAQAADTPSKVASFHPNDDPDTDPFVVGDAQRTLADLFDGTDSTAHLTMVASQNAERAAWYVCPATTVITDADDVITQAELTACASPVATDATGTVPAGGDPLAPFGEAFDAAFDIPSTLDLQFRDLVVLGCKGGASNIVEDDASIGQVANCKASVVNNVIFDDGQFAGGGTTSAQQTEGGEITGYCTADVTGGPGNAAQATLDLEPCQYDTNEDGDFADGGDALTATQKTTVDNRFKAFPHGSAVPNDGFVFRMTTDPTIGTATDDFIAIQAAGADGFSVGPPAIVYFTACTRILISSTFIRWECALPDAAVADNAELALMPEDNLDASGSGLCDTTDGTQEPAGGITAATDQPFCPFDVHYIASSPRRPTLLTASFTPNDTTGSPASNAGCEAARVSLAGESPASQTIAAEAPDTAEDNSITTTAANDENVELCLTDQFLDVMIGRLVTFEQATTSPEGAQILGCGPGEVDGSVPGNNEQGTTAAGGTLHDHAATGTAANRNDDCHTTTNSVGVAFATLDTTAGAGILSKPGPQAVTACADDQFAPALPATGQPAGHGCADAAAGIKAVVTNNHISLPTHLHYIVAGTGTATDSCHTGDFFKELTLGQSVNLTVCTMDGSQNFATTDQVNGGRLQHFLTTVSTGQVQQATRYAAGAGNPPAETGASGATLGLATVVVECVNEGTDNINVNLISDLAGAPITTAPVQIRCRRPAETQVTTAPGTGTPTSTVPPTTPPPVSARSITLESSVATTKFGRTFTLSGAVTSTNTACIANQSVTLSRTPGGETTQETAATATTTAAGTYAVNFIADKNATYVASLAASATCGAATSASRVVNVKAKVNLRANPTNLGRGDKVKLQITVLPCDANNPGTTVSLTKNGNPAGSKDLDAACKANFTKRMRRDARFRGAWGGDAENLAGRSARVEVNVR